MYTHGCTHIPHTYKQCSVCCEGDTVKIKRNVDLVTIPGVDNGRGHAASAEKMDRMLFTGK